jgi:DNA polymerase-1
MVVLGILYGRGAFSIAEQTGITPDEAKRLIKTFRQMFPVLSKFIESKKTYAAEHNGRIDTFYGNRIDGEVERAMTQGINAVIQSGASLMLG